MCPVDASLKALTSARTGSDTANFATSANRRCEEVMPSAIKKTNNIIQTRDEPTSEAKIRGNIMFQLHHGAHRISRRACLGLIPALLAATSILAMPQAALANGPNPLDAICIEGTVINHQEQLLTDGWTVTATPYDENDNPDSTKTVTTVSDAAGRFTFPGLNTGKWQVSLALKGNPGDWEGVTPTTFDVELTYGKSQCAQVRFKIRQIVLVYVRKIDDNHLGLPNWTIVATPAKDNKFALQQTQITNASGDSAFKLTPGQWVFSEVAPAGVKYEPVIPLGNLVLDVIPPGPYNLRFKNRIIYEGCVIVHKFDLPGGGLAPTGLPDWGVSIVRMDGSVAASGKTNALGEVRFDHLPLGPYVVAEEVRLGWRPASPSRVQVDLDSDDCVVVDFYNEQDPPAYKIDAFKWDTNGKQGLPGITINVTPSQPGGYTPAPMVTDGTGHAVFTLPPDDYRIPGAQYQVCEVLPAGWLNHTPICKVVTLPKTPGPSVVVAFENQQVGHWETTPAGCKKSYVIAKHDTWRSVARHFRVPWRKLMKANPSIKSRAYLTKFAGQTLCIP